MRPIDAVCLDAGGTLVWPNWARVSAALAAEGTTNLWEVVPAFVPEALAELRRLGCKLAVVSNANGTVRQAFDRLGLSALVDVVVDSGEEGVEKPDPRLFEIALARVGSTADRALHAGDIYHIDVVGARLAGLEAILIDEASLYPDVDCGRIASIAELPALVQGR